MAEYRICFSVAGAFGAEISFEAKAGVSYEDAAASIDKEKLAELMCLETLGYTANDIEIITPEQYDAEFLGGGTMMAEYIDRAKAVGEFEQCNAKTPRWTPQRVKTLLLRIPTADVAPVVHGRWVPFHSEVAGDIQYCSTCEIGNAAKSDFCPHCGAKMDGGVEDAADVPVSALRNLREVLYSNDLISMEGLRQLNALIAMHEGGGADG